MGAIHLTFDNGPHPEVTPRVLEVLERHGIAATFFVLGEHLDTSWGRALAERARDAGHRLGNHSWSHGTPLGVDPRPDAVERELVRTQALLDEVWSGPRWFRPFGGGGHLGPHLLSPAAVDWLVAERMSCVLWSSVPGDWLDADGWVDAALDDADRLDGCVVVLHDVLPDAMAHLDRFLDALEQRGHTFTHQLPDDCLPIREGVTRGDLSRFVQSGGAS